MAIGENVTGWETLVDGNMIGAVFNMYDEAFMGWTIAILFFLYQLILYLKTQNVGLAFITGIFFMSMYISSTIVKAASVQIIFVLLVFELAGIVYMLLFK